MRSTGPLKLIRSVAPRRSAIVLWAMPVIVSAGCYFGSYCPVEPDTPLDKIRLEGTWRLSSLGQNALPSRSPVKTSRSALMIEGDTFLTFDILGNVQYAGTLGGDQTVALWEINFYTGLPAVGLTAGLPAEGIIAVSNVRSSVAAVADGSVTVRIGWQQLEANGAITHDVLIVLEELRFAGSAERLSAMMSVAEATTSDPAPPQTRLIGEVLLEKIEPEIREFTGDISPAGEITARDGPAPPYNDTVTFPKGQAFDLNASDTTGPTGAQLTYYWNVVREQTDPNTNEVVERERLTHISAGKSSEFIAPRAGRYYVTLYVTDGVLWRSTQNLGRTTEVTRFVKVE
jgi:hypothetical protein